MATSSKPRALLSWSSGKDSAWSLHVVRQEGEVEIVGLLTTINEAFDRVAMHGVRAAVLEAQAEAAGLPLWKVPIPWPCPNEAYEAAMAQAVRRARDEGVTAMVFGDLFLRDVRRYREEKLAGTGLTPLFPLWEIPTAQLARDMIAGGLRARVVCLDPKQVPAALAGREYDAAFLAELPPGTDPCAERGEFHTCAYAGPMFRRPVPVRTGAIVRRDGFVFADLELNGSGSDERAPRSQHTVD